MAGGRETILRGCDRGLLPPSRMNELLIFRDWHLQGYLESYRIWFCFLNQESNTKVTLISQVSLLGT